MFGIRQYCKTSKHDTGDVMPSPKPPKYESHVTGHVKPDGQIYVGRKHAGKRAEVWFMRDDEDEVKE